MAQTEDPDLVEGVLNEDTPNNLMEKLRATAQESDSESFFQLAVPRYKNLLLIRYARALTFAEVDKIMRKVSKSKNPIDNLNAQCDVISLCTDSIWVRMEEDSPLVMLRLDDGTPMRWGAELLKYLSLQHQNSVRLAIQTVFGNDLAIGATQGRVFQWLQGELDEHSGDEVSGE